MSRYNRCGECYNMACVFVTGERTDFDTSECPNFRPMTNADRIRAYSDEELANVLSWLNNKKTADEWLEWLKGEVDQ